MLNYSVAELRVTIYKTPIFTDESLVTITNSINNYYIHLLLW